MREKAIRVLEKLRGLRLSRAAELVEMAVEELGWCHPRKYLPAEILAYARAAYPRRRSSNANSLQSQISAGFRNPCDLSKG
jgi:hypothetical protein